MEHGTSIAADPGHPAGNISAGPFEIGNYTFPSGNLSVGGVLFVENFTARVGIGTAGPLAR